MHLQNLENKSILILGYGREGKSTHQFLKSKNINNITIADIKNNKNYLDDLDQYQIIFKTPGIPNTAELMQAKDKGVIISSNTQLFLELFPGKTIGVTGTKGKSTTTALIHHILKENNIKSDLLGNMGKPALSALDDLDKDTLVVLELSSHQLVDMTKSPNIAVVLNIFPEHLDHFDSLETYMASKASITKYQKPEDIVVFNSKYQESSKVADLSPGKKLKFSDINLNNIITDQDIPLLGEHNKQNILPAIIIGQQLGLSDQQIAQAIKTFKALEHRLEFVKEINNVKYYNDSQGTNPEASIAAINSFPDKQIVLIAGGHEKNLDYSNFSLELKDKVRFLILFKPAGEKILEKIGELENWKISAEFADSMANAVKLASEQAQPGDIVLLSPATSSFGMFKNYQDRGNQFKNAVLLLDSTF
jgi:UDP-N-acetylmuramoylalanine--D-glutamate ligase